MASFLTDLTDPQLVARFQRWCGVELVDEDDCQNDKNDQCPANHLRPTATTTALRHDGKSITTSNNNNNDDDDYKTSLLNGRVADHEKLNGFVLHDHRNKGVNGLVSAKSLNGGVSGNESVEIQHCHTRKNAPVAFSESADPHSYTKQKKATRVCIRYPVLLYWARVGAFLGNEEFYLTGLPFLLWSVDSAMLRQTVVVWWLVMYLGQAGKDYFAWPRPPCPPVVRLETTHLAEYSMPSTHAMAGTAIPLLLAKLLLERYQLPVVPVVCVAFLWCFTTCLSRLYLGVHSILDVLSGFLVSLVLYFLVSPLTAGYDLYQQTHPLAPLVLVLTSLALCTICYPSGPGKTSAKGDAITTTSVVVGLGVGVWLNFQLGFSQVVPRPVNLPVSPPTLSWVGVSLLQFVVGVAVVYLLKVVMKRLTVSFFSWFFGLDRPDAQHPGVMVGATYTTYLCLGLAISFLDPLLFHMLGFGRPGFYLEVL
ncbi:sphingosine-1-phosphate phosphatase 2-like [Babylonia areolata]|uniref:sphingosine-1-phosphate phosphatase 2-like n=1 Tax=Babylonia areolata TaxID=304850 RepID=UPI003FD22EA3